MSFVMSCEIHLTAAFEGIDKVLQKFRAEGAENETVDGTNPFSGFEIAISPMGEIMVFAKSSSLLICESKWDSNLQEGPKIRFSPNWVGQVQCKHGEKVTSILCLPFFSYGQTVHGANWTCIVLGFSSGCVRFYTERMEELACNTLHAEPVLGIKSFCPALVQQRKTLKQDNNDIYVLYETVLCVFNGPSLSQTLLNRRNQMAEGITPQSQDAGAHTLLDFKKYGFAGQESISDACYLGQTFMSSCATFDHLVTMSYAGGFTSNYRASSPQTPLIVTSGSKPFVGFHFTPESGSGPVLADVALAVANKIKDSITTNLTDWFGFGGKKTVSQDKAKEGVSDQAAKLNCRFGLCDLRREAQSIICSPDGSFSAVSDSLGRVILLENSTGIALRLWKGFRDAQCGFIQADEEVSGKRLRKSGDTKIPSRRGLFVVIYAPKKGMIEIFCGHNGRKVCTFKVTKCGRLIYNPRGCISPTSAGGFALNLGQVLFVSEKGLTEFLVPFHCSLAEDSGKTSRDLNVLEKTRLILKTEWNSPNFVEDMQNSASQLQTDEVRFQVIDLMLKNRNISLESLKAVLTVFIDNYCSPGREESASKKMIAYTKVLLNLLKFYEYLSEINGTSAEVKRAECLSASAIFEEMRTTEKELDLVLKFITQIQEVEGFKKSNARVAFKEEKTSQIQKYLSAFDWDRFLSGLEKQEKPCRLTLKPDVKGEKGNFFQEHLFKGVLVGSESNLNEWSTHAESCCLDPTDLVLSLLSHWCQENPANDLAAEDIKNFIEVLKAISSLNDPNIVSVKYNIESPWWSRLRGFIASSPSTVRGLFAALCCRSVTIFVEQEREFAHKKGNRKHKTGERSSVHSDWVTLSKDICQWDILITQLQDVALLNAVLNLKLPVSETGSHGLPQIFFEFEYQCLYSIQQNGTGRVSELVAKWLTQFGIEPLSIVNKADIEFQGGGGKNVDVDPSYLVEGLDKANLATENGEDSIPLKYLALLKSRFPYSLTTSSLLSNLCWEYTAYWFKRVNDLSYLDAAVQCLQAIPATKIKYGISSLSWSTYFQQKVEFLSKIVNRVGKVPKDKLCVQEIGLGSEQVPHFLKLISNYLTTLLHSEPEGNLEFSTNREAIWQNCSSLPSISLMSIALAQPPSNTQLVLLLLQLTTTLHLMSSLNIKQQKVFSSLFDNVDSFNFTLTRNVQPLKSQDRDLEGARKQFLQKAITAAVQTVHLVQSFQKERIRDSVDDDSTTKQPLSVTHDVDNYKKWLQIIFDLATVWEVPLDDLRRHQICELYANGLDRMAEEVIPSVNTKEVLASQILVVAGKRLKYLIQDSKNVSDQMSHLSLKLSEWLKCLDIENFKHQNETMEDIEMMTRYVANWLPEDHPDEKLAVDVIETLSFFRP